MQLKVDRSRPAAATDPPPSATRGYADSSSMLKSLRTLARKVGRAQQIIRGTRNSVRDTGEREYEHEYQYRVWYGCPHRCVRALREEGTGTGTGRVVGRAVTVPVPVPVPW